MRRNIVYIRIHSMARTLLMILSILFIIPIYGYGQISTSDRAALEQQLKDVEKQISAYENTIDGYRKQGKSLNSEVRRLETETKKLSLEIKAIILSLAELDREIEKNKGNIQTTDTVLQFNKKALIATLQSLSESDSVSLIEILLANPELSYFFNNIHGLLALQGDLRGVVRDTINTRDQLLDLKEQLAEKKTDAAQLKESRDMKKKTIEKTKQEKNQLLVDTKGQEKQYQVLLSESQKTAAQIRSRIFEFLGGGQLTFEQAYQLAQSAAGMTGVRPALLLAVLDHESALGRNVGKCRYRAAMHPTRDIPFFLELTTALGINTDTISVSCANKDGAYGGAMGPAQFIPSTWQKYSARIEALTASHPPSPWRNIDAFTATALYLKDAGASGERNNEVDRKAAARYYAGSRWQSYLWTYGERVVSKARQFEEDIAALGNG